MSLLDAIIMGIIQGLTEFLPVSSSGHLVLFGHILGITSEGNVLFEILLHVGTLVAICIAFYKDIIALILNGLLIIRNLFRYVMYQLSSKRNPSEKPMIIETKYQKFVMLVIAATIPTVIIALTLEKVILAAFSSLLFPAIGLIITATLLLLTTRLKSGDKEEHQTTYMNAAVVGMVQGFATFPGVSRSGSTIAAGLLVGMRKEFVVEFSFIMSIPAVLGAAILQIRDVGNVESISSIILPYGLGMIASAVVGYICIKVLLGIVKRGKLHYFSYYCYTIGFILLAYVLGGFNG